MLYFILQCWYHRGILWAVCDLFKAPKDDFYSPAATIDAISDLDEVHNNCNFTT